LLHDENTTFHSVTGPQSVRYGTVFRCRERYVVLTLQLRWLPCDFLFLSQRDLFSQSPRATPDHL